jgi:hypothetical protein
MAAAAKVTISSFEKRIARIRMTGVQGLKG